MEQVLSIVLGGTLALLGTLLANYLSERVQAKERQRQVLTDRLIEVRRFIQACLEFVDIAYRPKRLGLAMGERLDRAEWIAELTDELNTWKRLPVKGSARALYTDDPDLLIELNKLDELAFLFYLNAKIAYQEGKIAEIDDKYEDIKAVAARASSIVDNLIMAA
jgi:hypothetical protein